jgi:uncharacterized repeat protein (TIGR03803 family)
MTSFFRLFPLIALTLFASCSGGDSSIIGTGASSTNTAPKGFAKLHDHVPNALGANPSGSLIISGGTLYGTTSSGGASGYGTIFKINPDGTGFTLLKEFAGTDGASPYGALISVGGVFYGTTSGGGDSGNGTIFSFGL